MSITGDNFTSLQLLLRLKKNTITFPTFLCTLNLFNIPIKSMEGYMRTDITTRIHPYNAGKNVYINHGDQRVFPFEMMKSMIINVLYS